MHQFYLSTFNKTSKNLSELAALPYNESISTFVEEEVSWQEKNNPEFIKHTQLFILVEPKSGKKITPYHKYPFLHYQNIRTGEIVRVSNAWYNQPPQARLDYYEFCLENATRNLVNAQKELADKKKSIIAWGLPDAESALTALEVSGIFPSAYQWLDNKFAWAEFKSFQNWLWTVQDRQKQCNTLTGVITGLKNKELFT